MKRLALKLISLLVVMLLAGCFEETTYTYRYRAGTWDEYNKLMQAYTPESITPSPLPPLEGSTEANWVIQSSEGKLYSAEDGKNLPAGDEKSYSGIESVLVSKVVEVHDPYTNTMTYKRIHYWVPAFRYYYDDYYWPYYGHNYYSYGYPYRGHRFGHYRGW
jgi:hypothetical protein